LSSLLVDTPINRSFLFTAKAGSDAADNTLCSDYRPDSSLAELPGDAGAVCLMCRAETPGAFPTVRIICVP
jgi:hypothetical protein